MPYQDPGLDTKLLEQALPTLTQKLAKLQDGLTPEERAVFSSIVSSAALHLKSMDPVAATTNIAYAKPISAAATVGVRNSIIALPGTLGLEK